MVFDATHASTRIQECAAVYRSNLLDRHVLFIPADGSEPFDCMFRAENFMHLCKVSYGNHSKTMFFETAADGGLDPGLLRAINERQTNAKLSQLPVLCRIDAKANAAVRDPVDHQGTFADLFCSNSMACIGFKLLGDTYVPKTALEHNPARDEPGYVNLLAAVKTKPGVREFTIVSKEPKSRDKTERKHSLIIRSLLSYPQRSLVEPLLDHGF